MAEQELFDLSKESFDGPYAEVHPGVYTFSEKHFPAGVEGFGHVNNRGFVYVVEEEGKKVLLMSGIPSDHAIPSMKKLEEDTGLNLFKIVGSGDFHHMALKFWLEAFPQVLVVQSGLKFPTTRNGKEILANPDFKKRIELVKGPTFPTLDKYKDTLQFFGFNQSYVYSDKPYMSKDAKTSTKLSTFGFLKNFASEKADQQFLAVWVYHVPSKMLMTEHNFNMFYSPEHHSTLPFMMRMMIPKAAFSSSLKGPMPQGPTKPEECKKHCEQWLPVLELDVRGAMDYHSLPGVMSATWSSKEGYKAGLLKALKETGEHKPDGSGMNQGKCCIA